MKLFLKKLLCAALVVICIVMLSACDFDASRSETEMESGDWPESGKDNDSRIRVVCTIFPQYDFVRQIAGDRADVKLMIPPGSDVHFYEPSPQDIIAVSRCDLFIYVGGESDEWADEILASMDCSNMEVISMMDYAQRREEETTEGMWGGGTDEADYDEHVWTSPENCIEIVEAIRDRLCIMDSENQMFYRQNAQSYILKLRNLQRETAEAIDAAEGRTLVFGDRFPLLYYVKEFGLDYRAAFQGCSSESEPGAATVAYLIDYIRKHEIPVIFKLELSSGNIAEAVAEETGAKVRTFYSCHNLSKEDFENGETYLSMMQKNIESLKEALK